MQNREKFASRLGFILISAGCAIGLGNVWRFPYITGQYGGAAFVLIYLLFLLILGMPIMVMEFAVGRASQKSAARSFHVLEPRGTKWHFVSYIAIAGNYLLMMFYTTVGGWMLAYMVKMITGEFNGLTPDEVGAVFGGMLAQPGYMTAWMIVTVMIGFFVCSLGLQNGVERITKVMMSSLFIIMIALAVRSVTLEGAAEGLAFYLVPDFGRMFEAGIGEAIYAALGQAFFTLSLGIGALAIFGSYIRPLFNWRSGQCLCTGHYRSIAVWLNYFSCLLCVRHRRRSGAWFGICNTAKRVQPDGRRSAVGLSVLPVHELCCIVHRYRCI